MINNVEAIYEDGVFRPLLSIPDISEGQRVRIVVEIAREDNSDEEIILELAASVYGGLSDQDVDEIESIALNRGTFNHETACLHESR